MASWSPSATKADPKPVPRHKASAREWREIREQLGPHPCVHCGEARDVSLHHAVPKSQGGDDLLWNMVPLCGDGVRGCHGLLETHGDGWERVANSVRQYVCSNTSRWAYVLGKLGEARFDRRYPSLTVRCPNPDCLMVEHAGPCVTELDDEAFYQPEYRRQVFASDFKIQED